MQGAAQAWGCRTRGRGSRRAGPFFRQSGSLWRAYKCGQCVPASEEWCIDRQCFCVCVCVCVCTCWDHTNRQWVMCESATLAQRREISWTEGDIHTISLGDKNCGTVPLWAQIHHLQQQQQKTWAMFPVCSANTDMRIFLLHYSEIKASQSSDCSTHQHLLM